MKAVVIILGVMIVLTLGALITGLVLKMNGKGRGAESNAPFTLARGATIVSSDVSGSRLILHVKTEAGEEIDIIDTADGRLVSRIVSAPAEVPTR